MSSSPLDAVSSIELAPSTEDAQDLILVSPDNEHFHTWSRLVVQSSPKLATLCHGYKKLLRFHDPVIESASVIRLFLQLLTEGVSAIRSLETEQDLLLLNLGSFMRKYQCREWALAAASAVRVSLLEGGMDAVTALVFFALAEDVDACVWLLTDAQWEPWGRYHQPTQSGLSADSIPKAQLDPHEPLLEFNLMDVRAMPFKWYLYLPPNFAWALSRLWTLNDLAKGASNLPNGSASQHKPQPIRIDIPNTFELLVRCKWILSKRKALIAAVLPNNFFAH